MPLFIRVASLAAHLPGVLASLTTMPVMRIPFDGGSLGGADALYAVVQMPPGRPGGDRRDRERRREERRAPRRPDPRPLR